jgi:hypothetical protein
MHTQEKRAARWGDDAKVRFCPSRSRSTHPGPKVNSGPEVRTRTPSPLSASISKVDTLTKPRDGAESQQALPPLIERGFKVKLDIYLKAVLTVIAVTLVLLLWSSAIPAVRAQRVTSLACVGKIVPAAGFDMKSPINPMYEISVTCQ